MAAFVVIAAAPGASGCFEYAQGVVSYPSGAAPAGCVELGRASAKAPYRGQALRELEHQAKLAGGDAVELTDESSEESQFLLRGRLLDCRRTHAGRARAK